MPVIHYAWASVLTVIVCLAFLFSYLKVGPLAGLAIMIAIVPVNMFIMGGFQRIRKNVLLNTDKRVKSMNEVLQNIRIVKFFAWEGSFTQRIKQIRHYELIQYVYLAFVKAFMSVVLTGSPVFVSVTTFGLFSLVYGPQLLTPDIVFPSLSFLNILRMPVTLLPIVFMFSIDSLVSINRIGSLDRKSVV